MDSPLHCSHEPVVKAALGDDWSLVPQILQRNFNVRPGEDCEVCLKGRMYEVSHSRIAKIFVYAGRLIGALVPYKGEEVPIRIDLRTHESDPRFTYWHRVHCFPKNSEYIFASRMERLQGNEIIERVRLGFGMRMKVSINDSVLKFEAVCYQWDFLGVQIKFPNWLMLGTGVILEREISADEFEMVFEINHPWWGRTYTYAGRFRVIFESP